MGSLLLCWRTAVCRCRLVDVVAEEEHDVEVLVGEVRRTGSSSRPASAGTRRTRRQRGRPTPLAGVVRVRPTGLISPPARNRYQYQRSACRPLTSTWTECASSAGPVGAPPSTTSVKRSSLATSHSTATSPGGMPPPSSGFGARRVHSTTPLGRGSPEATPSVNGGPESARVDSFDCRVVVGLALSSLPEHPARTRPVPAATPRNRRRLNSRASNRSSCSTAGHDPNSEKPLDRRTRILSIRIMKLGENLSGMRLRAG